MTSESAHVLFLTGLLATGMAALALPQAAKAQPAPKSEKQQPPRTDRYGDPLPKGAIGRIGTIRFLYGGNDKVAFSPDGKVLAGIGPGVVSLWDAATGKELRRSELPSSFRNIQSFYDNGALSADGRRLWLRTRRGAAFVWDLHAQPDRGPRPAPFKRPHTHFLVPSPDGKIVAAGDKTSIRLWDAETGNEVRCLKGRTREVTRAAFSADGKILASSSDDVHLWDVATGRLLRAFRPTKPRDFFGHFALSADGKTVAAATDEQLDPINLWDAATGKEIRTILGSGRTPSDLAFAPDGKILVFAGMRVLRAWDISSGKQLWEHEGKGENFNSVAFSPDGKMLASGGARIRLWKVRTGAEIRPVPEDRLQLQFLAVLGDGKTIVTGEHRGFLRLWRLPRLEAMSLSMKWPSEILDISAAISADGKVFAWTDSRDGAVCLYDISSAKILRRLPHETGPWYCRFSPDGKRLITAINQGRSPRSSAGVFQLWDVESGKPLRRFEGGQGMPDIPVFSADGKQLAVTADNHKTIRIWAVESGQTLRAISVPESARELALSSDGRLLAAISRPERPLRLWEIASGKEIWTLHNTGKDIQTLHNAQGAQKGFTWVNHFVLSPDNRRMIVSDGYGNLLCWDIRSGTLLGQWRAHATSFAFLHISADNQTVVTSDQTTTLVWSLAELLPKEKKGRADLLPAELSACWADLKDEDATRAYRAIWRLSASPPQAVAFLRERLRPAREPDKTNTARIAQLVGDLDSDAFATREKASHELATFGKEAEPALRKALASSPSAECKRRIEELMRKIPESLPTPPPEQLRQLRALAALEDSATQEAKKCLQTLAGGAAEARLTREAKATLDRLARKSKTAP